jgi:hypothetical protein
MILFCRERRGMRDIGLVWRKAWAFDQVTASVLQVTLYRAVHARLIKLPCNWQTARQSCITGIAEPLAYLPRCLRNR